MSVPSTPDIVPPVEGVSLARSAGDRPRDTGRRGRSPKPLGGTQGGPLGNTRIEFPPPTPSTQDKRLARFVRRAASSQMLIAEHLEVTREKLISPTESVNLDTGEIQRVEREQARLLLPARVARCSWALGQLITLHGGAESTAHYSGTERCGSISACPVCAPVIRSERAQEISQAVTAHQESGGSLVFVTLTIRHKAKHLLAETLDTVITSWQKLLRGKPWLKFKSRHQIGGFIRSIEITRGKYGWHPHIHAIFFLEAEPSPHALAEFESSIFTRWSGLVTKDNGDFAPTPESGIDCQLVDDSGTVVAAYLSKLQEEKSTTKWGVGAEMTRGDLKDGRETSLIPFQLLDQGDSKHWIEYVRATKGRRIITWSKGLKDRYSVEERDDEEILDDAEKSDLAWTTTRNVYEETRTSAPSLLAVALGAVETENWELLYQLLPGHRPPQIEQEE